MMNNKVTLFSACSKCLKTYPITYFEQGGKCDCEKDDTE